MPGLRMLRHVSTKNSTLGTILLDDELLCYTLEDQVRRTKVYGKTAIPEGNYSIILRKCGGFHERYKQKFPWHKGMLWLADVPNFEFVYLHIGNTHKDSKGCILVGEKAGLSQIYESAKAYEKLYKSVVSFAEKDRLRIKISNSENIIPIP